MIDALWIIALQKLSEEIVKDYRTTGTRKRTFDFDVNIREPPTTHNLHVTFEVRARL